MQRLLRKKPKPALTPGQQALRHAQAWAKAGVIETSRNRGPEIDNMKRLLNGRTDSEPWCADFVTFMFLLAGYDLRVGKKFNWRYCPSWKAAAIENTKIKCKPPVMLVLTNKAKPGTVALFDWDNDGVPDHIGFIEKDYGIFKRTISTPIQTQEGNTGGDPNDPSGHGSGDGVHRKWRLARNINTLLEVKRT
jgi:hypothetical protein